MLMAVWNWNLATNGLIAIPHRRRVPTVIRRELGTVILTLLCGWNRHTRPGLPSHLNAMIAL